MKNELLFLTLSPLITFFIKWIYENLTERKAIESDLNNGMVKYYNNKYVFNNEITVQYITKLKNILRLYSILGLRHHEKNRSRASILTRHFLYAFVYTVLSFYTFWLMGSAGTLGQLNIIIDTNNINDKLSLFACIIVFFISIVLLLNSVNRLVIDRSNKKLLKISITATILLFVFTAILLFIFKVYLVSVGGIGAAAIIISTVMNKQEKEKTVYENKIGIGTALMMFIIGLTFNLGIYIVSDHNYFLSGTILITIIFLPLLLLYKKFSHKTWDHIFNCSVWIVIFAFSGWFILNRDTCSIELTQLLIFIIWIPIVNGIYDFCSTKISIRFFTKIMESKAKTKTAITYTILDIIFAFIFLIMLVFSLGVIITFYNYLVESRCAGIDFYTMIYSVSKNPFSISNLWITMMIFTTLLPTFLHMWFDPIRLLGHILFNKKRTATSKSLDYLSIDNMNNRDKDCSYKIKQSTQNIMLFKALQLWNLPYSIIIIVIFLGLISSSSILLDYMVYIAHKSILVTEYLINLMLK